MKAFILGLLLTAASFGAYASPVGGGQEISTVVPAYSTDAYTVTLLGGEETLITFEGDCAPGEQDIDLWVYDENGYLIDKVTDYGCSGTIVIFPKWTGPFSIHIENDNHPYNTRYWLGVY
jgi:hypothetical protein